MVVLVVCGKVSVKCVVVVVGGAVEKMLVMNVTGALIRGPDQKKHAESFHPTPAAQLRKHRQTDRRPRDSLSLVLRLLLLLSPH